MDVIKTTFTNAVFEDAKWHDNKIHGFFFRQEKFVSDIVFDIDFILEWLCKETCKFKIAPASLVFHNVTDLRIVIDWGDSDFQRSVMGMHIVEIKRNIVKTRMKFPEYYKWNIELSDKHSEINFGASGFTQYLRSEAIWTDKQFLTIEQRENACFPYSP